MTGIAVIGPGAGIPTPADSMIVALLNAAAG